ncbi:MAG: hypothetical protein SOY39_01105 [Lachnospiraceae bacterium]|nr:hypothetical protein [Lachnospiraceae bacterium]
MINLYRDFRYLLDSEVLTDEDRAYFQCVQSVDVSDSDATSALYQFVGCERARAPTFRFTPDSHAP